MTSKPSPHQAAVLIRTHQTMVWRYLRYLGAAPQQADDLTQEVFLAFLRGGLEERGEAATAAWLRRVAHNLLHRAWRDEARRPTELLGDGADEVWVALEASDAGAGRRAALRECLDGLATRARRALEMRYRDSAGREEIGTAIGIAAEGVKALLRRSRAALRECVDRRVGECASAPTGGQP